MYIENLVYFELHEQTNKPKKSTATFHLVYLIAGAVIYLTILYTICMYVTVILAIIIGVILHTLTLLHLQEQQR